MIQLIESSRKCPIKVDKLTFAVKKNAIYDKLRLKSHIENSKRKQIYINFCKYI